MREAYYRESTCYICKNKLSKTHHYYTEMCPGCGEFNFKKRNNSANLKGYTAIVTGGRIKIGFETAIKLLDAGAHVIVTSRFPRDTYKRYSKEKNYKKWKDRLNIYGIDFRHIPSVEEFIYMLIQEQKEINIIINNAAQTVRKPPIFYRHLIEDERKDFQENFELSHINENQITDIIKLNNCNALTKHKRPYFPDKLYSMPVSISADLSQIPLLPEDYELDSKYFPIGKYDKDGQQEDRRELNSWMLELEDVSLIEFYEVINVNLIAPFLLNTRLKPILSSKKLPSFIINVTAMEGIFFAPRKKTRHPHTNMAKAALNMMTRTVAAHYEKNKIFMNSVDTGWITNEKPHPLDIEHSNRKSRMAIDEVDGAARILDPIFSAINENQFYYGKLFKNYNEHPW